jgi:hypothetical protein
MDRDFRVVRSDVVVFLGAFVVCLLFRLPALGDLPLWYDEVITADAIRKSWGGMVRERLSHGHFATYFALLKALGLSGSSELALRLPSAILDCAAGGLVAVIARRIGGFVVVVPAALLYATFPILIIYGQEARPYALQLFFITLAMFGQVALLTGSGQPRCHARIATVGALGAIVTIPASAVIVAIQHLAVLFCGAIRHETAERRIWIHHIGITWIGGLVSLALLIPAVMSQAKGPTGLMKWNKGTLFLDRTAGLLDGTYGFKFPSDIDRYLPQHVNFALMTGFFVLSAIGFLVYRRSPVHRYLAVIAVGTFCAFAGISFFTAVANRYLIGMMPAAVLLASMGGGALIACQRTRWLALPLIALLGVGIILQSFDTLASPRKYDWRPIVRLLHENDVRRTTIYSDYHHVRRELRYYADDADGVDYFTIAKASEPIEKLWGAAVDLPIAWFVLTARQVNPPKPTAASVSCIWSFGKMKVVMVARDRSAIPATLEDDVSDLTICSPSV